jgi:hypothetical protein
VRAKVTGDYDKTGLSEIAARSPKLALRLAYRAKCQATTQNQDSLIKVENSLIARFNSPVTSQKILCSDA